MLHENARKGCRIGVVEDDPVMGESLQQRLVLEGCAVDWWTTGREAIAGLRRQDHDLVICDIRLPDMDGGALFRETVREENAPPFFFITAHGEIDQAVALMRAGAGDYLTKPFAMDDFLARVRTLLGRKERLDDAEATLGVSDAMRGVERLLRRVADLDSALLITGETGSGKEVCARFVHQASPAAQQPFMAVNCAAIPDDLLESELFGHEKGAFTGAQGRHLGYAERAKQGVLFLDEVGEMPLPLQTKLLRLLEERSFHRVGGERPLPFQARLVCATNQDLEAAVRRGSFREDLFFRINVIPVAVPPLRERQADIPVLLHRFVAEFSGLMNREVEGVSALAEEACMAHDWPGNVRELRNRVERAVALARGTWIMPGDLFPEVGRWQEDAGGEVASLAEVRDAAERRQIQRALKATGGQVMRAAELLSVSRTTLWEKMRRLGIEAGAGA
ncbi:MAG: sigma-54 dependent transcriptional regulator [Kiloniellaceae bacterium]